MQNHFIHVVCGPGIENVLQVFISINMVHVQHNLSLMWRINRDNHQFLFKVVCSLAETKLILKETSSIKSKEQSCDWAPWQKFHCIYNHVMTYVTNMSGKFLQTDKEVFYAIIKVISVEIGFGKQIVSIICWCPAYVIRHQACELTRT